MNHSSQFSFLAQVETGQKLSSGLFQAQHSVCSIDEDLRLGTLISGPVETSASPAKAAEILSDDLRTNQARTAVGDSLQESFANIHEYLQTTNEFGEHKGIGMVAVQAADDYFHVISAGGYQCYHVRGQSVTTLLKSSTDTRQLGCQRNPDIDYAKQAVAEHDLIMLISEANVERASDEFIRLTLSRFAEQPDVVLRQINTRMAHRDHGNSPNLMFVRCESMAKREAGWLKKLLR